MRKKITNNKISIFKVHRRNINSNELTLGERNSRLLLVIAIISTICVLYSKSFAELKKIYSELYINTKIPIGAEHVFIIIFLACLTILFLCCLAYCYAEFFNFCNFESLEDKKRYQQRAEKMYKFLLGNLILSTIFLFASIMLFSLLENDISIKYKVSIVICFAFIILLLHKELKKFCHILYTRFLEINGALAIILAGVITAMFTFFMMGFSDLDNCQLSNANFKFIKNNGLEVQIVYNNKIPDKTEVTITNASGIKKLINLDKNEFYQTSIEVTKQQYDENNKIPSDKKQVLYDESNSQYYKNINIEKYLANGKNSICIQFKIDGLSFAKKDYELDNNIYVSKSNIDIFKDNFQIPLN